MQADPDIAVLGTPTCASEPIRIPGSIQPNGLLLLFDAAGKLVRWAGNFGRLLGIEPAAGGTGRELLGTPLADLIAAHPLLAGAEAVHLGIAEPPGRPRLSIQAHRTGRFVCVELQEAADEAGATGALESVRDVSRQIAATTTLADACSAAAAQVRSFIGFDRVMVYRFLEDGSGSVIAEARAATATAYLNHRFPASDIPRQARDLYRRNIIRTIPDVGYKPWPLEPARGGQPIDMSHCVLRSVSPVHIQYLKNMDVGASMSISILVNGELWGLIACHHHEPRPVPENQQLLCRHVGTSLAAFILSFGQADNARLEGLQQVILETSLRRLRSSAEPEKLLRTSTGELQQLIECGGFVLLANGEPVAQAGRIPAAADLRALASLIEAQLTGHHIFWTDRVAEALPGAPAVAASASGVLAIRFDASEPLLALWLRPEQIEEISWAGDPRLKQSAGPEEALTPRRSFATWRESVGGRSRPWMWHEINAAELFQSRAGFTLQRHRLERLNLQLAKANAGLSALATTDPLTGLANRRLFDERLHLEWQRALRQGKGLGLVAIDVDHFKKYNDGFGHPAGDECLKRVAGAIDSARRSIDITARIGGEEFAILLPDADRASTVSVAERVRRAVEQLALDHPHCSGGVVTISVGTAVGWPAQSPDSAELMNAADRALYQAKSNGRNRVAASE